MKKFLLTVIASLALCGSIFAQYESHWADLFDAETNNPYEYQGGLVAFIQINGTFIDVTDNYAAIEIGAFVGDQCRGHAFMIDETELGDPYPSLQMEIYCNLNAMGDAVTFVMYDHATGTEYTDYTCNYEIVTGDDHFEAWDDPETAVVLNFTSGETTSFEINITGYDSSFDPETNNNANYYLIASPIGNVSPSDVQNMLVNNYNLFAFDQTQQGAEWQNYDVENFELEAGKGYLYANSEDVTLTFTGTPYDGDGIVTLAYNGDHVWNSGDDDYYWNLVGNPFAVTATVDREFYVMNENGTDFVAGNNTVEAMEGLFVNAEAEGESVTFAPAGEAKSSPSLALNLTQGRGVVDRAVVRFTEGRMLPKFQMNPNHTKVYIPQDGNDYAVVRSEGMGEMPVNFKAEKNGTYTLSFTSQEVSFNYLHLIDNMTGADVDLLANPSYSFNALTTDYASRFKLVFATGNNSDDSFAFMSNGSLIVSNEGNATLQVIDLNGRILSSETINGSASVSLNAAAGVYTLRLVNGNDVKVQKIVIR